MMIVFCFLVIISSQFCAFAHRREGRGGHGRHSGQFTGYAQQHSTSFPPALEQLFQESMNTGGRMTGDKESIKLNMMLIRSIKGTKALDVGLLAGFSAVGSALAVQQSGGKVIGMDISDRLWNQVGRRYAEQVGCPECVSVSASGEIFVQLLTINLL